MNDWRFRELLGGVSPRVNWGKAWRPRFQAIACQKEGRPHAAAVKSTDCL